MDRMCEKTGAKAICSLEQTVYVLLNDKSRMKGDFQVRPGTIFLCTKRKIANEFIMKL